MSDDDIFPDKERIPTQPKSATYELLVVIEAGDDEFWETNPTIEELAKALEDDLYPYRAEVIPKRVVKEY
jgi:hypothetical protein